MLLRACAESPLSQNLSIVNPNSSSILVKWSPPFLWPGHSINHYIISIGGTGESRSIHYVNATFDDAVVTFLEVSDNSEIWNCNELQIAISAITDNSDSTELPTFTVIGGYLPGMCNKYNHV